MKKGLMGDGEMEKNEFTRPLKPSVASASASRRLASSNADDDPMCTFSFIYNHHLPTVPCSDD